MDPAYHIPVEPDTLRIMGEVCAIQGQIEWSMQNTVRELLKIGGPTALQIMGSTSIAANAEIWLKLITEKAKKPDADALAHAKAAFADMRELAEGRNDFIHAMFFSHNPGDPEKMFVHMAHLVEPGQEHFSLAVRVRNRKPTSLSRLREIRDKAACVSIRVAHVHWAMVVGKRLKEPSPFLGRLSELPVPPPPKQELRRARAPKAPPQP